jgi:hypothetical protein
MGGSSNKLACPRCRRDNKLRFSDGFRNTLTNRALFDADASDANAIADRVRRYLRNRANFGAGFGADDRLYRVARYCCRGDGPDDIYLASDFDIVIDPDYRRRRDNLDTDALRRRGFRRGDDNDYYLVLASRDVRDSYADLNDGYIGIRTNFCFFRFRGDKTLRVCIRAH